MVALCTGTSFAKHLYPAVGAAGACAWRVGGSALLLTAVWRPWRFRLSRRELAALVVFGLVLGAMNLSFYLSLRTTPLGLAIAIEFMGPLAVAIAGSRSPRDLLWVALAALGIALIVPLPGSHSPLDPTGVGFACAAAAFWALYIILGHRTGGTHAGLAVAMAMLSAAVLVVPVGVAAAGRALLRPEIAAAGLGVAILSSALPYSLEIFALQRLPKRAFGILASLEPALGALAGVLLLGEALQPRQWLAIALVISASLGTVLADRTRVREPELPAL